MNDQSKLMMNQQHQVAHMGAPPPQVPPQMVANQMSYGQWTQPPPPVIMNPPMNMNYPNSMNPMFVAGSNLISKPKSKPGRSGGGNNSNWKGKKPITDNRKRKDYFNLNMMTMNNNMNMNMSMNMNMNVNRNLNVNNGSNGVKSLGNGGSVSTIFDLEQQNRVKGRRFYHAKRKFNRMGPYAHAPRNTTSYLIRAKKSGGIASLVSPCPVTPAVLPTPVFSPSREALVDMAKEEWGVDGYGSMKGLIRLRSPGHDESVDDYDEDEDGGSSGSDVEEHVEVERRLDHDLSRFEMIVPNSGGGGGVDHHNLLENRVDDQDTNIARLEEENLILKERLYLMEREVGEMRRRLLCLERRNQDVEDVNEEVLENVSENYSEGLRNIPLLVNRDNEEVDSVPRDGETGANSRENSDETMHKELKKLAVKDIFRCEGMESNEYSAGLEGNMCKDGSLDDGVGFGTTVAKKCEEHDQKLAGELNEKLIEKCESMTYNDLGSADGTKRDIGDDTVKGQSVGDVYVGENVPGEVNDIERLGNIVNNGSEVILKMENETMVFGTQAEGSGHAVDNKAAVDAYMEDMVSTDKAVGDHKSDS